MAPDRNSKVRLSLVDSESSPSTLASVSRELTKRLNKEPGLEAKEADQEAASGSKGLALDYSQILLTLISGGGAIASLINVLKSFVDRKQSLKIELTRADGQKLVIEAEGLSKKDFAELQSQLHAFMEGK